MIPNYRGDNILTLSKGILYKSRDKLNSKALYPVYRSLIVAYITYCVQLWGSTFKTTINSTVLLQQRAISVIIKAGE